MKEIDLENLKGSDLVDVNGLVSAYKEYLINKLHYFEGEAEFASKDMLNPYDIPYILQDYEGCYDVEGILYEVRSCKTDYCRCGMFHFANTEPFEFYMLFNQEDIENETVGEYMDARKMYIV